MTFLRWWLIATGLLVSALFIWAFAPVLVFIALLFVGLGALSAIMIGVAHLLRRYLERQTRQ